MIPSPELRHRLTIVAPSVALAYFVLLGGTPIGEQLGVLRIINSVIGATFVVLYIRRLPRRADAIDLIILAAFLLVTVTAVASPFPRQAVDALLAMLAYAAVFYVARDLIARPAIKQVLVWTLRLLSAAITVYVAIRYLPSYVEWLELTEGSVTPPLGLPMVARPWGHAYDLTTLAVMLLPSWMIGPRTRMRIGIAVALGSLLALIVFLLGSRAQWLAIAVASVALLSMPVARLLPRLRPRGRWIAGASVVVTAGLVVAFGGPILERLLTPATVVQRVEMWSGLVDAWAQRPIFGFGPGTFPWVLQQTTYFDTNSIHPRHPDNAFFQLLAEGGMLGMTAAGLVVGTLGWRLLRARAVLASWPILVFLVNAAGANPTDFSYLIIIVSLWAVIGLPRRPSTGSSGSRKVVLRPAFTGAMLVIAIPLSSTLVAGLAFDAGARDVYDGHLEAARADFTLAIALDPSMALYVRQRGITNLLEARHDAAIADLQRATAINPNDDLGWRALAIALRADGRSDEARDALDETLDLQRSDKSNLLLRVAWQAQDGDIEGLRQTLAEVVLAWPTVVGAPGWDKVSGGNVEPRNAVELALDRWERGQSTPEPLRGQLSTLALLGERPELLSQGATVDHLPRLLANAAAAVTWCEPDATDLLESMPSEERRISTYWALRVQNAAERQEEDPDALTLFRLSTFKNPSPESASLLLNPLRENNERGSVDSWGYDRVVVRWDSSPIMLPSPDAGSDRLLVDPRGARRAMGFSSGPGDCSLGD